MKKRGISMVVSTILIVALVIVVSAIAWTAISKIVTRGGGEISVGRVNLDLRIVGVSVSDGKLIVNVQREKGQGELKGIKFIIENGTSQEVLENETILGEFDSSKFSLSLSKFSSASVIKVSVAPILSSGIGDIRDVWEAPKLGVNCVPVNSCPDVSTLCTDTTLSDDCGVGCTGTIEPVCPSAETVNCGIDITSTNECSGCSGKGTKCDSNFECLNDVCVEKLRIFVTREAYRGGDLGGTIGADAKCNSNSAKPTGGTGKWKALIGTLNRQVGGSDWVLQPSRKYYQNDGISLIDITGENAWFTFDLNSRISSVVSSLIWTGIDLSGNLGTYNCNGWTTLSGGGNVGSSLYIDSKSMHSVEAACSTTYKLYCVEQL